MLLSFARNIRRHPTTKLLLSTPRRLSILGMQKLNKDVFAIEIQEDRSGFFAIMQLVLFVLKHCDEENLVPYITARGGLYGEPSGTVDWFGQLFSLRHDISQHAQGRVRVSRVRSISDLGFRARYEAMLTLPEATALFNKTFLIAPQIDAAVAQLVAALGVSSRTLAVHYRGTDKKDEASPVAYGDMIAAIRDELKASPVFEQVLLATDEPEFRKALIDADIRVPVIDVPMRYASVGGRPVHFSGHPGLAIGREALVTCLLLSRSGMLIKTASYLSAWAKVFNPGLRVHLLADSRFFPDHALWKAQGTSAART